MSSFGNNARSFYFTQPGDQFDRLVGELYGIEASSSLKETIRFNNPHILDWNRFPPGACIEVSPSHSDPISVTHWRDDAPRAAAQWVALDREVKEVIEAHPDIVSQFLTWAGYGTSLAGGGATGIKDQIGKISDLLHKYSHDLAKQTRNSGSLANFKEQLSRVDTQLKLKAELNELNSLMRKHILTKSREEFSLFNTSLNKIRKHLLRIPSNMRTNYEPLSGYLERVSFLRETTMRLGARATYGFPILSGAIQIDRALPGEKLKTTFRAIGGIGTGAVVGSAAYMICTNLFLAPSAGTSIIWCGLIVSGGASAAASLFGEGAGEHIYNSIFSSSRQLERSEGFPIHSFLSY